MMKAEQNNFSDSIRVKLVYAMLRKERKRSIVRFGYPAPLIQLTTNCANISGNRFLFLFVLKHYWIIQPSYSALILWNK